MMELILNRIYQYSTESRFIVICPWKPKAQWFPELMKLSTHPPLRIPSSWTTVQDMAESGHVPGSPTGDKIKLTAWKLSGRDCLKLEDCPVGLSKEH